MNGNLNYKNQQVGNYDFGGSCFNIPMDDRDSLIQHFSGIIRLFNFLRFDKRFVAATIVHNIIIQFILKVKVVKVISKWIRKHRYFLNKYLNI